MIYKVLSNTDHSMILCNKNNYDDNNDSSDDLTEYYSFLTQLPVCSSPG